MSEWSSAVDSVIGELSTPPPPASPERAAKAKGLSELNGVPADIINLDPETWQLRYQTQKNALAIQSSPELQSYLAKNELNKKISSDDLEALKATADKARASLPTIRPSDGDWRQVVLDKTPDPYELAAPSNIPPPPSVQLPPPMPGEPLSAFSPTAPPPKEPDIPYEPGTIERGFQEAFKEPLGLTPGGAAEKFFQKLGGGSWEFLARPSAQVLDAFGRVFEGSLLAGYNTVVKIGQNLGLSEDSAKALARDITFEANRRMLESAAQVGRPGGEVPLRLGEETPAMAAEMKRLGRPALPTEKGPVIDPSTGEFIATGQPPLPLTPKVYEFLKTAQDLRPDRTSPIAAWARTFEYKALPSPEMAKASDKVAVKAVIDDVKAEVARTEAAVPGEPPPTPLSPVELDAVANQAVLNSLVKSAGETATKARSPSSMHDFAQEAAKDSVISVPVDAVTTLYAEKGVSPAQGDGVLGFVPDIVQQVDRAKLVGGDVVIPLAGYLAHVSEETHKALQGNLRVGEGPTVNESKTLVEDTQKLQQLRDEQEAKAIAAGKALPVSDAHVTLYRGEPALLEGPTPRSHPGVFFFGDADKVMAQGHAKGMSGLDESGAVRSVNVPRDIMAKLANLNDDTVYNSLVPDVTKRSTVFTRGVMPDSEIIQALREQGYTGYKVTDTTVLKGKTEYFLLPEAVKGLKYEPAKAVEAEPAQPVEPTPVAPVEVPPVASFEGDMVVPPSGEAIQPEVTEADFSSRFSLDKAVGTTGDYSILRDNRIVGSFKAQLDPGDPSTIKVSIVDVPASIDRPGAGDIRKLFRELQRDFPTATHVQGERIGGSRMGASSPRTKIPTVVENIRKRLHLEPLYQDAKAAGMTETEFKAYSKNLEDYQKLVAEKKRATAERNARREYKELSSVERAKAEREFDDRQVIQAESLLKNSGVKLDDALVDRSTVPRGLTAPASKGAVAPDDIAGALGYSSGAELLRDLEGLHQDRGDLGPADYRKSVIERQVTENVPEMPDFADELFSEPLSRVLYDDLRVMYRQPGGAEGSPPLALEELQRHAKEVFDKMSVKDASNLRAWTNLVAENGKKVKLALLQKDFAKAFKSEGQQLMAHLMAREAVKFNREFAKPIGSQLRAEAREAGRVGREARKAVEEALVEDLPEPEEPAAPAPRWTSPTKLMERYGKRKPPKNVSPEFVDQIQRIFLQHGVKLKRDTAELQRALKGKTLQAFVKEKNDQGASISVADFLYEPEWAKPLDQMTVQDHRNLFNSVRSLDHAGREEKLVQIGKEKIAKEVVVNAIADNLGKLKSRYDENTRDLSKGLVSVGYWIDAVNVRVEQMFRDMDHRDPLGPLTALMQQIQRGKHYENDLIEWAAGEFNKLPELVDAEKKLPNFPYKNSLSRTETNKLGYPYPANRLDVMMIAAQLGNESSAKAVVSTLFGGMDAFEADPEGAVQNVKDYVESVLTPTDWKFVESLWSIFSRLKPIIDDLYVRTSGVAPDTLVPTPWNGHTGGYFPIIHDPWGGEKVSLIFKSPFESNYRNAATPNSYTKDRTGKYMPVRILDSYHLLPGVLRMMIHDVALREPINNVNKVLSEPKVLEAINGHYGLEYTHNINYWLRQIANPFNQNDAALGRISQLMSRMRQNIILSVIAANVNVLLSPNLGPLLKYLGERGLGISELKAQRIIMNDELWKFAIEKSGEIRHRMENTDRDLRDALMSSMGTQSQLEWIRSAGAQWLMRAPVYIDRTLMIIAWSEEFTKARDTGKTFFYPDEIRKYTEQQAIEAADALVRQFFGSHNPVDLPTIMRLGETGKTFLSMFQGFQNAMYGNTRDAVVLGARSIRRAKQGDKVGARSDRNKSMALTWMFFLVTAAFGYLYGKDKIDKMLKQGKYGEAVGTLLLQQALSLAPGFREIGAYIMGYQTRPPPASQAIVALLQTGKEIKKEIVGERGQSKLVQSVIQTAGALFGIPGAQQFGRSAQYLWNVTTGQDEDKDFSDWLRGLTTGKAKK